MPSPTESLPYLLPEVARIGREIVALRQTGLEVTRKPDGSPVTNADFWADAACTALLQSIHPLPVISEESLPPVETPLPTKYWCVDPIDGTYNYIDQGDLFSINIALIENGVPVFGLLHFPARAITAMGGVDLPSRLYTDVDVFTPLLARIINRQNMVATVSSPSHGKRERLTELLRADDAITEIERMDGPYKFLRIAEGSADIYPRLTELREWDLAAGHAIIEAAGGRLHQLSGEKLLYGQRADWRCPKFVAWGQGG